MRTPSSWFTRPATGSLRKGGRLTEAIYEPYSLHSIRIPGAQPQSTALVQSAAMTSVVPPKPSYRIGRRGSSPKAFSPKPSSRTSSMRAKPIPAISPERRRSMRASTTSAPRPMMRKTRCASGAGGSLATAQGARNGRPAGIVLDNWLKDRRKALWISKSDKL